MGESVSERDATENALCDAVHDAFLQFWRAAETEQAAELRAAYCAAQARYDAYLTRAHKRPQPRSGAPPCVVSGVVNVPMNQEW